MLKYFLLVITALLTINAYSINCNVHPIACSILKINKNLDAPYALYISNIIYNKSKHYNIDRFLVTAIFAQESRFQTQELNCKLPRNITKSDQYEQIHELISLGLSVLLWEHIDTCGDFGIGQINIMNIKNKGFDIDRLLTDAEYAIDLTFQHLAKLKRFKKDEPTTWWARYHSATPKFKTAYIEAVCNFYNGSDSRYCSTHQVATNNAATDINLIN